ncbi:MAG: rpl5p [Nitrososphaeraceae archaeon]|nr:rpl5p [Nitrososphaeraceae archaeon]
MNSETSHSPMKNIAISKVVINIGVGRSGEPVERAKKALNILTGQQPKVCGARNTVRDFGIHKGEPIGAMVTLRRDKALDFLKRVIAAKGNIIKASSFDDFGNLSIGIHEHIDIPGTRYDPDIGIFGMDVCMALSRPGYRISRKRNKSSIGKSHRIKREDAISFLKQTFGVEVA